MTHVRFQLNNGEQKNQIEAIDYCPVKVKNKSLNIALRDLFYNMTCIYYCIVISQCRAAASLRVMHVFLSTIKNISSSV